MSNVTRLEYKRRQGQDWIESVETFAYDWLDRLVSAQGDYGLQVYSYDSVGNRLTLNDLTYTCNSMNELLSISDGSIFTYDLNGNTVTKTDGTNTWSYIYDTRNQLTQVEKNQQVIAQYSYDGDGRRIKKTEWIESLQEYQTIVYVYSGSNIIYEKNINTDQEATYVYGPTGRMTKDVSGLRDYYHTDHLGSTRLVTDENGAVLTEAEYEPFGTTEEEEGFLYTGKEKDTTGLYYYGARYYDPEIGRFLTRDPLKGELEYPQTQNRYIYCLNNPLKYIDPRGLDIEFVILPDGTISYEMAELYNKMQKALDSLTEEEWKQINDLLGSGDPAQKMEAIKMILDAAGIEYTYLDADNSVAFNLGDITFTIQFHDLPLPIWGTNMVGDDPSKRTILISTHIHKGGDLFLVLGHELAHAYMTAYHGKTLKSIEQKLGEEGKDAYMELISYQWEFSVLNQVPHVTLMQRETIEKQFSHYSLLWYIFENNPK